MTTTATANNALNAMQWVRDNCETPTRCAPSHLCDGWSGCIRGLVTVHSPAGSFQTRLQECLRPCGCVEPCYNRAAIFVYPDPERPQFAYAKYVPAAWIAEHLARQLDQLMAAEMAE